MKRDKPFSKNYVIKVTSNHMKNAIDRSIYKSFERIKDTPDKSVSVLETIDILYRMKSMVEEFEKHNPDLFNEGEQE